MWLHYESHGSDLRPVMKKFGLLLLAPLLSFLLVPMSIAYAVPPPPNTELFTHCWANGGYGPAGVTVTLGHTTVYVSCTNGQSYYSSTCVTINKATSYRVMISVEGLTFTQTGKFHPLQGAINGHQYGPYFDDYAEWFIGSPPVGCA